MFPFLVNAPTIEYPLSGNVVQEISPAFFAGMEGVPEIEHEVVTRVASYGAQIGALTDAVLVLAKACGVKGEEIKEVERLAAEVTAAKDRVKDALRGRAEASLRRLKQVDPEGFGRMTLE